MNIVKGNTLEGYADEYPHAKRSLMKWFGVTKKACWKSFQDVKHNFKSADNVRVKSKRMTVVFNINHNEFRLIAAIHYDKERIYILRFLTHAEYDLEKWKEDL